MKRILTACLFFAISTFCFSPIFAQQFTEQMRISADGKRLLSGGIPGTGLYDIDTVRKIELFFSQPNYWQAMLNFYQSKTNIPALMIVDGDSFPNVGVRFKGQTSFSRVNADKKSFNITMDFMDPNQDFMGYETLNLNNCYDDPSFIREVFYYHFNRINSPCAQANFSQLYINGQNWGLYPSIQQLDNDFIRDWFLSSNGTRWRCEKTTSGGGPGGGGVFGTGFSTLNYLGQDSTDYKPFYTLKKTSKQTPWEDLKNACDRLNNQPANVLEDSLKNYFDVDKALWFVANEIIFGDDDGYVYKGGMDYYAYWEPETNRLTPLEYDGNTCMGDRTVNWSPFYKSTDPRFPIMNKLIAVPAVRQRYLAHFRTILKQIDPAVSHPLIDSYVNLIDSLVQADPKKLYSYNNFLTEIQDLKNYIIQRRNNLLVNSEVNATGLTIDSVVYNAGTGDFSNPDPMQSVNVTAQISGLLGVQEIQLFYQTGLVGSFEKTLMYDDGMHGDGAANDGTYGGTIPGFGAGNYVRYYIGAVANNAARTITFMPEGAEHDVFIYRVNTSVGDVVINEFMASNDSAVMDANGEYDDWIELYNNAATNIDLSGWYLSDDSADLQKWTFPAGTSIAANDYLIVWADDDAGQAGLHASFKLAAGGESIFISDPNDSIMDQVVFGTQTTDMSYARVPNGTGSFVIQPETYNANNNYISVRELEKAVDFVVYPNPAQNQVFIQTDLKEAKYLKVYGMLGQKVYESPILNQKVLDVSNWSRGVYFIQIGNSTKKLVVQ